MLKKTRPRPQNHRQQRNVHSNGSHGADPREDVKLKNKAYYQQNFDKYTNYAKEALRTGDRIDAENFFQHAEHYLRFLNERVRYDQEQQVLQNQRNNQQRPQHHNNHLSSHKNTPEGHSQNQHIKRNPIIDSLNEGFDDSKKDQYKQKIESAINEAISRNEGVSQATDIRSQDHLENQQKQQIKKKKFLNKSPSPDLKDFQQIEEREMNEKNETFETANTPKPKLKRKPKETIIAEDSSSQTQESIPS